MNLTSNAIPGRGKGRYHKIDGWRGYTSPALAVAGASDTGTADDSPCPTPAVLGELRRFRREALQPLGIKSVMRFGSSSNVFCGKRWVCVADKADFPRAAQAALDWIRDHRRDTNYIHCADQGQLGYKESDDAKAA